MREDHFIIAYERLSLILRKTQITRLYIEEVAKEFNVRTWDEKIVQEVFRKLKVSNPYKVDISGEEIRRMYWDRYRSKKSNEGGIKQQKCTKNLCDGYGVILTNKKAKTYNYNLEYGWRCSCFLGQSLDNRIPLWNPYKNGGNQENHAVNKDNVYVSEQKKQDQESSSVENFQAQLFDLAKNKEM